MICRAGLAVFYKIRPYKYIISKQPEKDKGVEAENGKNRKNANNGSLSSEKIYYKLKQADLYTALRPMRF